jgi:hypothetical protein
MAVVVGMFNNHFMVAKARNRFVDARLVDLPFPVGLEGREFVVHYPDLPVRLP